MEFPNHSKIKEALFCYCFETSDHRISSSYKGKKPKLWAQVVLIQIVYVRNLEYCGMIERRRMRAYELEI